jgi:hypothetical protein
VHVMLIPAKRTKEHSWYMYIAVVSL